MRFNYLHMNQSERNVYSITKTCVEELVKTYENMKTIFPEMHFDELLKSHKKLVSEVAHTIKYSFKVNLDINSIIEISDYMLTKIGY